MIQKLKTFVLELCLKKLMMFQLRGVFKAQGKNGFCLHGLVTLSLCCIVRRQKIILTDIFSLYQTSLQDASLVEHMDYQHLIN